MKLFLAFIFLCFQSDGALGGEECPNGQMPTDNDDCLTNSPGWASNRDCAYAKAHCEAWAKDAKRCCPQTCESGLLTPEECQNLKGKGTCLYPTKSQCGKEDYWTMGIYYFNHPICGSAEYKGDVLEMVSEEMEDRTVAKKSIENFLLTVKANVASKFGANIICGAKYESNIYSYSNGMYVYKVLTMTFTGTAMKTL